MKRDRPDTIFVAGASGAVGQRLCRLLVDDGWRVCGTTRATGKVPALRALGVEPVVVDVFDAAALCDAVVRARPAVVIHQLTALPPALDPARMAEALVANAQVRDTGTRHLIAAAIAAGTARLIAQSVAFAYAAGPLPYHEDSPLAVDAAGHADDVTVRGVVSLERQVLGAPLAGLVLRYGQFYGPGTGFDAPPQGGPVHVDAAADAARRAVTRGAPGIYNVAEDDGTVASLKAARELGWHSGFRIT